jgi:hypothetical protein
MPDRVALLILIMQGGQNGPASRRAIACFVDHVTLSYACAVVCSARAEVGLRGLP